MSEQGKYLKIEGPVDQFWAWAVSKPAPVTSLITFGLFFAGVLLGAMLF